MYHVTLVNLSSDARFADPSLGQGEPAACSPAELAELLKTFRELDPLQNASADPEIHVHYRRARHIVRTGQGRLMLYDSRDNTLPALVLTVEEILAEFDGSAAAARSKPPFPGALTTDTIDREVPAPLAAAAKAPAPRKRLVLLSSLSLALGAAMVALWFGFATPSVAAGLDTLPAAEAASTAQSVAGVYVTGQEPGSRGIVVAADGSIRFFQLNAGTAPSFVRDTWRPARHGAALCLVVVQLDTLVEIVDRDTLAYCGERYRRAAQP